VEQLEVHADVTWERSSAKVSFNSNLLDRFAAELRVRSGTSTGTVMHRSSLG
jgi:hypothetical protein